MKKIKKERIHGKRLQFTYIAHILKGSRGGGGGLLRCPIGLLISICMGEMGGRNQAEEMGNLLITKSN